MEPLIAFMPRSIAADLANEKKLPDVGWVLFPCRSGVTTQGPARLALGTYFRAVTLNRYETITT